MENPFPFDTHLLLEKGFQHLHLVFLPQLNTFNKHQKGQAFAELLHLCYELEVPNQGIYFGDQALKFGMDHFAFYELFITMHLETGAYLKAFQFIQTALELHPDYLNFHHIQQQVQDYMNYDHEPKFDSEDWNWKMNELLVQKDFDSIESTLRVVPFKQENILFYLRYYSASNQVETYHQILEEYDGLLDEEFPASLIDAFYCKG